MKTHKHPQPHPTSVLLRCTIVAGCLLWTSSAIGAICGDPDGNGVVTVSDGVQCLRVAVGLTGERSDLCDADGKDGVTVTDGVRVLRDAAGLSTALSCGSPVTDVIGQILKARGVGTPIRLNLDFPPEPGNAATLTSIPAGSADNFERGRSSVVTYSASYVVAPSEDPTFLLYVRDEEGNAVQGYFELPLSALAGTVELLLAPVRGSVRKASIAFATRSGDQLSDVRTRLLRVPRFGVILRKACKEGTGCLCDNGTICTIDDDCLDRTCADESGCRGGSNNEQACDFNSECTSGVCVP